MKKLETSQNAGTTHVSTQPGVPDQTPEKPAKAVKITFTNEQLQEIATVAHEKAAEVRDKVNPTNVFAEKYTAIAEACETLLKLRAERGHHGIPEEG